MSRKIIGSPYVLNEISGSWENVGGTDVHRVQRSVEQPIDPNVEIWIKIIQKTNGSTVDVIMLKDGSNNWYAPNDKNEDGIDDYADACGNAENADKLGNQAPSYYATTTSVTNITNGTTTVGKANRDGSGNIIISTYATKTELNNVVNGTTKVAKATLADKATQDGSGNTITSTYATVSALNTANTNITNITNGTTVVGKATKDGSGNTITSYYATLSTAQTISGAKTFSGATKITNTTAASSTTTGALIVSGGIGVAGDIYANKVHNAVWNDYAERRLCRENILQGMIVIEDSKNPDYVKLCNLDCCVAPMVISDTYGFCMGEYGDEENGIYALPVGLSGRVLAYVSPQSSNLQVGDVVCSSADGKIRKMKWWEKVFKPECIIGTVSSIPEYETWGDANIQVNGRIWIKIK